MWTTKEWIFKTQNSGFWASFVIRNQGQKWAEEALLNDWYWIIFHCQHLLLIPVKSLLLHRGQVCEWMAGYNYSFPNLRDEVEKWGWKYGLWLVDIDWVLFYTKRSITSNSGNHPRTSCHLLNISKNSHQLKFYSNNEMVEDEWLVLKILLSPVLRKFYSCHYLHTLAEDWRFTWYCEDK